MRKPWIVAGMVALLAIGGTLALGTTALPVSAADTTATESDAATAPAAAEEPAETASEPAADTAEQPAEAAGAEAGQQPAAADATAPAETTEQPAEQPAETAAEPAVEAAPEATVEAAPEPEEGIYPDDKILGSRDAPITIIEYASLSCPHCAAFHAQVLPQLKSEYVEKGQVRFIYRDFPLNWPAVQGALLARCAPDDARFFGLIDTMFKLQNQWLSAQDPGTALKQIGALAGMSKEKIEACFADTAMQDKILMRRQEGEAKYGVDSTPSFIINGKLYTGVQTFEMLQGILKDLAPKG